MARFVATHRVTLKKGSEKRIYDVMLQEGVAYTKDEWDDDESASWEVVDGKWCFRGEVSPWGNSGWGSSTVTARRIGSGRTPRNGAVAKPVTFRAPPAKRARWEAAAKAKGRSLSEWLTAAADAAAGRPAARRIVRAAMPRRSHPT